MLPTSSSSSKVCPLYSGFPSPKTKFRHLSLSLVSSSVSPWFVMLRLTQGRGVHVTGVSAAYTFKLNKNILSE
jgi:hypothetical protein